MFYYDLHRHTAATSACARMPAEELAAHMQALGYAGTVLTNHFYFGNSAVRRHLPWADFVAAYEQEWLTAQAIGERLNFPVLFGIEEHVGEGKEVLLYGITLETLYAHPEWRDTAPGEERLALVSAVTHGAGGLVYQAHPFRVRDYIANPWEPLPPRYLDGIETYNGSNMPLENARAAQYARQMGLPGVAGSDAHIRDALCGGIGVDRRLSTGGELVEVLRRGDYALYTEE